MDRDDEEIQRASILDVRCPTDRNDIHLRRSPNPQFFLTDYCVVDSLDALGRMAHDALDRPPFATLEWIGTEAVK
jgi:hypothetical protein